ncbi:MAG: 3-methyl-2-oxobutanoate hydroxymethyltransferase [SAR324 cluster bacterium]|nr:3-methyl-2-oxobutanoate hydroxymethyltransferase [SAR324 cluster bacterium]
MKPINITKLTGKKGTERQVWATAYDAWMASIIDGLVDVILVGDSLGMMVQGQDTTLPVTLDEMIYHTKMVARGCKSSFLVADMPFMSYQVSTSVALESAGRLLKEGGAKAVKLEGGFSQVETIKALTQVGIPVVGHLGMTPQSVHAFGGFGKQAKTENGQKHLLEEALAITEAGCFAVVLENVPHDIARDITQAIGAVTIGIGAGGDTDGQVQVFHDLFGLDPNFSPKHAVVYSQMGTEMQEITKRFAQDVREKKLVSN